MTASVGAAACPDHGMAAADVLRAADDAVLRAKAEGRNRVCVHGNLTLDLTRFWLGATERSRIHDLDLRKSAWADVTCEPQRPLFWGL